MHTFDVFDRKMEMECEWKAKLPKKNVQEKYHCLLIRLRLPLKLNIEVVLFFRNQSIIIVVINNYYN